MTTASVAQRWRVAFTLKRCFISQQCAEKSVKAVHYALSRKPVIGHSIHKLMKQLNAKTRLTDELLRLGGELDQYYVSARYPDALPGIAPSDAFSATQARAALSAARKILSWAKKQIVAK